MISGDGDSCVSFSVEQSGFNAFSVLVSFASAFAASNIFFLLANLIRFSLGGSPGTGLTNALNVVSYFFLSVVTVQYLYFNTQCLQDTGVGSHSAFLDPNQATRISSITTMVVFILLVWCVLPLYLCGIGSMSLMKPPPVPTTTISTRR